MIGQSVSKHFKSEMDLVRHEAFKEVEENDATLPVEEQEDTCLPMEKKVDTSVPVEKKQDLSIPIEEKEVTISAEVECIFREINEALSAGK